MRLPSTCLTLLLSISVGCCAPALAQYMGGGSEQVAQAGAPTPVKSIQAWFAHYDTIRRQAQMNPAERAKADKAMSGGLSMFMPGEEKNEAQGFLRLLVQRDSAAADQLKQLPLYPETEKLHRGYYQYFTAASQIFADYIKVQDHPLSKDETGQPLAASLMVRKQNLEALDQNNKALDAQLRQHYGIAPYHY
jgi:hypothetical protein